MTRSSSRGRGAARPAVTLAIVAPTTRVAAFVTQGQRVDATLLARERLRYPLDLDLRAVTSDLRWTVDLLTGLVLDPGATTQVPLAVRVPPDASRDVPVRITVAARTLTGAQATASFDVTPAQDAAPVSPSVAWPLPDALLGGLDVAATRWAPCRAGRRARRPSSTTGTRSRARACAGTFREARSRSASTSPAIDPVPVAGTILDATALEGSWGPPAGVRAVAVGRRQLLGARAGLAGKHPHHGAGVRVAPARRGTVREAARPVQLGRPQRPARPWRMEGRRGTRLGARRPRGRGFVQAGGHVVWTAPDLYDSDMASLLEGVDTEVHDNVRYCPEDAQRLVIGFRDDRAAQVERLEWVEQAGTDPAIRFARAHVGVSTGSPLGPWRDLGVWDVSLRADGTVTPFDVPDGTWARFVQLTLEVPADQEAAYRALPGRAAHHRACDGRHVPVRRGRMGPIEPAGAVRGARRRHDHGGHARRTRSTR
ncbi:MAG: hypothetical protein R3C32_11325 [Chloroflexota bacterium]